jgi:hypothetical protein
LLTTSRSSGGGRSTKVSARTVITRSDLPRRAAAAVPATRPRIVAVAATVRARMKLGRSPKVTMLSPSRPSGSVPRMWLRLGPDGWTIAGSYPTVGW